jgi:hypothetical protein
MSSSLSCKTGYVVENTEDRQPINGNWSQMHVRRRALSCGCPNERETIKSELQIATAFVTAILLQLHANGEEIQTFLFFFAVPFPGSKIEFDGDLSQNAVMTRGRSTRS